MHRFQRHFRAQHRFVSALFLVIVLWTAASVRLSAQAPASIQVMHNTADTSMRSVGVWIGVPSGTTVSFIQALNALTFRQASPALGAFPPGLPSLASVVGVPLQLNITAGGASAPTPSIQNFSNVRLGQGANMIIARGLRDTTGYVRIPDGRDVRFRLNILNDTLSSIAANSVRLFLFHGCTDAPRVDVFIRETNSFLAQSINFDSLVVNNFVLGDYTFDVRLAGTTVNLGSFQANFRQQNLGGKRVMLMFSGFLNPQLNRNGAAFGIMQVVNDATTPASMLPATGAPAPPTQFPPVSFQAIHACADPDASPINVWVATPALLSGSPVFLPVPAVSSFAFNTATPALTSLASGSLTLASIVNTPLTLNLTPATATQPTPPIRSFGDFRLAGGANYAVAVGLLDTTRFAPNPNSVPTSFTLLRFVDTVSSVQSNFTRIVLMHTSTDAPAVTFTLPALENPNIGTLRYSQFGVFDLTVGDYIFQLTPAGSSTPLSFQLPLRTRNLGGQRIVLSLTGFANPARNRNGTPLGVLASVNRATESFFMLQPLMVSVQANTPLVGSVDVQPNPLTEQGTIVYNVLEAGTVEVSVYSVLGQKVATLLNEFHTPGTYPLPVDVRSWQNGMYIVKVQNNYHSTTTRLMVAR